MTLKEFEKILQENKELYEKLKKAKKEFKFEQGKEAEAMSKLVSDLGYDVPASEFALKEIGRKEINEEELKSVAGGAGRGYHIEYCEGPFGGFKVANWGEPGCVYDYSDTDCVNGDYCDFTVVLYPSQSICRFDYRDTDCWSSDSCDWSEVDY